tara:strand:- start:50 stop:865 length:816 start_codon:yes stop_codon:yes gene_type:complete
MEYFLVLGIEYKKYKSPADITIHVGDKFIDTFQLDRDYPCATNILQHIEPQLYGKFAKAKWCSNASSSVSFPWKDIPSLFRVYKINEHDLKGTLDIKVENANSDYNNGFMKNSSMLKLSVVGVFKKDLVKNRGEKMMKIFSTIAEACHIYQESRGTFNGSIPKSKPGFGRARWPNAGSFFVSRENGTREKNYIGPHAIWLGGSFTAEFIFDTKYHTKYLGDVKENSKTHKIEVSKHLGFLQQIDAYDLVLASCTQLLNIYDEDQRSNSTKD